MERTMAQAARVSAITLLRDNMPMTPIVDSRFECIEMMELTEPNMYTVKANVHLPHASIGDVMAMFDMNSTQRYQHGLLHLFGDLVVDGVHIHEASPNVLPPDDRMNIHWLALQNVHPDTQQPRDFVYLQYTTSIHDRIVSVWDSIAIAPWNPFPQAERKFFRRCGFVVEACKKGGLQASFYATECAPTPLASSNIEYIRRLASSVSHLDDALTSFRIFHDGRSSFFALPSVEEEGPCALCQLIMDEDRPKVTCAACNIHCCLHCTFLKSTNNVLTQKGHLTTAARLCRSCARPPLLQSIRVDEIISPHPHQNSVSAPSTSSSSFSTPRHTLSLATLPSQLYPHVKKKYKVHANDDFVADMRDLGRDAVDGLLQLAQVPMTKLKQTKQNISLYEHTAPNLFTMKAVTQIPPFHLFDLMALLDMRTTVLLRETLRFLFESSFVDGAVLYSATPSPQSVESMTLNWLAIHNAKMHLPTRDYVFLKYGDCIRRPTRDSIIIHEEARESQDIVGVSVWESVDLDSCGPLPNDLNILRMTFRKCGILLEPHGSGLKLSFFISEVHARPTISSLSKTWLTRMAMSIARLPEALMIRFMIESTLRQQKKIIERSKCRLCAKRFSFLRRKHRCALCLDLLCKACMDPTPRHEEIRACVTCCAPENVSLRKYWEFESSN